jgi:hypothetical protein
VILSVYALTPIHCNDIVEMRKTAWSKIRVFVRLGDKLEILKIGNEGFDFRS